MKFSRILAIMVGVVGVAWTLASLMVGLVVTFGGCPTWMELPWSDFGDFVEASDGRVYVIARFYSRVLCYSKAGEFIGNYAFPVRNAKDTKLAAGRSGLVYFRSQNGVYTYQPGWRMVAVVQGEAGEERIWKLSQGSRPVLVTGQSGSVPNRVIMTNEFLFSPSQKRIRQEFFCAHGSTLERDGDSITRVAKDGHRVSRYAYVGILSVLRFPWPSVLGAPLFFVAFGVFLKRR